MESATWTSLEIAKLAVAALGPIAVIGLGYFGSRLLKQLEAVQWANQTVVKRRLEIFSEVAPKLNRIVCFALFIGLWKEIRPRDVIQLKREVDEVMFANRVLFSPQLFEAYRQLMKVVFLEYAATDGDAPLRVPIAATLGNRRNLAWWEPSLEASFAEDLATPAAEINTSYQVLCAAFQQDLYVTRAELSLPGTAH